MAQASTKPWSSFSQADYTPAQWARACLINLGGDTKDANKLPVKEPDGTPNVNGMRAAAAVLMGARGGVDAPADAKRAAAKKLASMMASAGMTVGDGIKRMAGMMGG